MSHQVPTTGAALSALARITLTRVLRGKLLWVSLAIAFLPVFSAGALAKGEQLSETAAAASAFAIEMFVLAILPPLFAAPAIGEEIENRTATYLWSRPLARWVILAGKLLALIPFAVTVILGSWIAAIMVGVHHLPTVVSMVGLAAGTAAVAIVAAGIATLAPKRGMALAIIYILIIDLPLGAIPQAIQWISVTHATSVLAGFEPQSSPVTGGIVLLVISALWLGVAFRRIGRLET